jgi:MFS family permease
MLSKLALQERIGRVMGIGQSLSTLGRILGPTVGGATYQYLGVTGPYLIGAVAIVVAFLLSLQFPICCHSGSLGLAERNWDLILLAKLHTMVSSYNLIWLFHLIARYQMWSHMVRLEKRVKQQ